MEKAALLKSIADARKRAKRGDLHIAAQHKIITELKGKGFDSLKARLCLEKLIAVGR